MKLRVLLGLSVIFVSLSTMAATRTYTGNGAGGSGIVSQGSLVLSGNVGGSISFAFNRGAAGEMQDYLVLFLDSRSGGFNSTAGFRDPNVPFVSGYNGSSTSTANFSSGFGADYALVIRPGTYGAHLYQLGNSLVSDLGQLPGTSNWDPVYTSIMGVTLSRDSLGMQGGDTLRFQSGYVAGTGYRTLESFEPLAEGSSGAWGTLSYAGMNAFEVQPVPEMTNVAAMIFGGVVLGVGCVKRLRRGMRQKRR